LISDCHRFGHGLRAERERRGISLESIAAQTKIKKAYLRGLEEGDFSNWPAGEVFRRAYVRDYATAIGLSPETVFSDFLRLFAQPERDASTTQQLRLVGIDPKNGNNRPAADRRATRKHVEDSKTVEDKRLADGRVDGNGTTDRAAADDVAVDRVAEGKLAESKLAEGNLREGKREGNAVEKTETDLPFWRPPSSDNSGLLANRPRFADEPLTLTFDRRSKWYAGLLVRRMLAAALDVTGLIAVGVIVGLLTGSGMVTASGVLALLYFPAATVWFGQSLGSWYLENRTLLRQGRGTRAMAFDNEGPRMHFDQAPERGIQISQPVPQHPDPLMDPVFLVPRSSEHVTDAPIH